MQCASDCPSAVCMCVSVCVFLCVCVQVSAVSTLHYSCKMLPPWRDPVCFAVLCLLPKQLLLGTPGSTVSVDSPVSAQHALPEQPAL